MDAFDPAVPQSSAMTSDRPSQSRRILSPIGIGLLTGLAHFGISLSVAAARPDWLKFIGLPAIPPAIALLEAWDPIWANFSDANPTAMWLFLIATYGANFLIYFALGWFATSWLCRSKSASARSGDSHP